MKRFFKKFLTIFLCFQLVFVPVARAESGSFQANTLMFASVLAAPFVLKQCYMKPSAWMFIGTSAFFLVSELTNSTSHKEDMEKMKKRVENSKKGGMEEQIEALEAAAEASDRSAKSAKTRSRNFTIAAVGYGAAAAAALAEALLAMPGTSSTPPGCILPDQGNVCTEGACQQPDGVASGWGGGGIGNTNTIGDNNKVTVENNVYIFNNDPNVMGMDDFSPDTFKDLSPPKIPSGSIQNIWNWLIPAVSAQVDATKAAASTGTGGMREIFGNSWKWIKEKFNRVSRFISKALNNGFNRAIIFGAFAAIATWAALSTASDAGKYKDQAREYRDLAEKMRRRLALSKGLSTGKTVPVPTAPKVSGTSSSLSGPQFGNTNDPCVVGKSGQYPRLDPACACAKKDSCKETKFPKVSYPTEFAAAAATLNGAGNLVGDYANKIYRGDVSGAANLADSRLSRTAAKVKRLKGKLWKMAANQFKKQGKSFDGNRLEDQYANRLKNALSKDFKKLSASDGKRLASLSPAFVAGPSLEKKGKKSVAKSSAVAAKMTGGAGAQRKRSRVALSGFQAIDSDDDEANAFEEVSAEPVEMDDKPFGNNIVHNNKSGRSIWKIITERYVRSFNNK